jgi:hypothetical protein
MNFIKPHLRQWTKRFANHCPISYETILQVGCGFLRNISRSALGIAHHTEILGLPQFLKTRLPGCHRVLNVRLGPPSRVHEIGPNLV